MKLLLKKAKYCNEMSIYANFSYKVANLKQK